MCDIGLAIKYAKQGKKIGRAGWNGKGMYVVYVPGYPEGVSPNPQTAKVHSVPVGGKIKIAPYLVIRTPDGTVSSWAPSGNDALADDWEVV